MRRQSHYCNLGNRTNNACTTTHRQRNTWTCPSSASNRTETIHTAPLISDNKIKRPSNDTTETVIRQLSLGCRRRRCIVRLTTTSLFYWCNQNFTQSCTLTLTYGDCPNHRTTNSDPCHLKRTSKRFSIRDPRGASASLSNSRGNATSGNPTADEIVAVHYKHTENRKPQMMRHEVAENDDSKRLSEDWSTEVRL